jgi:transcriptional regulator with XRE-family HTH domain
MTPLDGADLPPGAARDLVDLLRRLASACKSNNVSIAQKGGVSASYVSQIMHGRKIPSPDVAARLINAVGGTERDELTARGLAERAIEARRYERAHQPADRPDRTSSPTVTVAVDFLLAIDAAHLALRQVAETPDGPGRANAALRAVAGTTLYADRERLLVSAEPALAAAGEAAFLALVALRTEVKLGAGLSSPAYHAAYHAFADAVWSFRQAIRVSAGQKPLTPAELSRENWTDVDRCEICNPTGFSPLHR